MTNINDISDLAQVLQDNPQWRGIIRSILLGDELAQLPGLMAECIQATPLNFQLVYERLDLLEGDVAGLKAGQARLEEGQARLEERTDQNGRKTDQDGGSTGQNIQPAQLPHRVGLRTPSREVRPRETQAAHERA